MKRILSVFAIGIFLLTSVLLFNTFRFSPRQMPIEPAAPLTIDKNNAAQHLSGAIRFKTVSHQNPAKIDDKEFLLFHRYLEQTFPKAHATLKKETVRTHSLLYQWQGKDQTLKPILLMGHQDVVPAQEYASGHWEHPPFSGKIKDGFVWGRGTLDDKGSVIGILEAVEALMGQGFQPKRSIYLAFGHDEEVGGKNGAIEIAKHLRSMGVEFEYILDEGLVIVDGILPVARPVAMIGIAEKGYVSLELTAEIQGGHSSMPPPETAIGILGTAVSKLEKNQMPGKIEGATKLLLDTIGREMTFGKKLIFANLWLFKPLLIRQLSSMPGMNAGLRTTTAVTIIEGGFKENVLPAKAKAVVNFRILPGDSVDDVLTHARDVIDDPRVKINTLGRGWEASPVSDIHHSNFKILQQTIRQIFPDVIVSPAQVLGGTDARHYAKLSDNIYRFLPVIFGPEDLSRPHGANERISIDDYTKCIQFYYQLIKITANN